MGAQGRRPNQYLHVDTTFWRLPDGLKTATVFVTDNYSKHILEHCTAQNHSFINVVTALRQALDNIRIHHPNCGRIKLIADGGSENHALGVNEFLDRTKPPEIQKLIALKDVSFSNSPVEVVNKIFKQYLRLKPPLDFNDLQNSTKAFVLDYTTIRPHGTLKGQTPFEAYTGQPNLMTTDLDLAKNRFNLAKTARIEANRKATCSICE